MIPVTKTFLPPLDEYEKWVKKAFDSQWITNRGDLIKQLEKNIKEYLNVDWLTIVNNGTIPLQIALKVLAKNGEIITTPFSYVATTSSIIWEGCKPVFVDIHPEYLTIDESKIENVITANTTAILATHVFGNPCNIEIIKAIAEKHNLKVIYDAAHCFGVRYKGESVFNFGNVSTCSFHATKLFHTAEGGAFFTQDIELQHKLFYSHNFGHNGPLDFYGLGINGKISELHGAMGLSVLPYIDEIIDKRKRIVEIYNDLLDFSKVRTIKIRDNTDWNYSYYPIIFKSEEVLLRVLNFLSKEEIFPRRYFYPSLNTIDYVKGEKMPVSEDISKRILCLPLYYELKNKDVTLICEIINSVI